MKKAPHTRFKVLMAVVWIQAVPALADATLDDWVWRNPLPQGHNLIDVAYGNGTHVAVGDGGTIMTSLDNGLNWTVQNQGAEVGRSLDAIIYVNGQFMAVGKSNTSMGLVSTSPDGTNWTDVVIEQAGTALTDLAYGNGTYVAVASSYTVTSVDGIFWDFHTATAGRVVTYGDGKFVAGGQASPFAIFTGALRTSTNGVEWITERDDLLAVPTGLTYGNGTFVAVGYSYSFTSNDGTGWSDHYQDNSLFNPEDIDFRDGNFCTAGQSVFTSANGVEWSFETLLANFGRAYGIVTNVASAVAVGLNGALWSTADGGWTQRSSNVSGSPLAEIAYGNGTYVAVSSSLNAGSQGGMFTSPDAETWTPMAAGQDMRAIIYADGRFVAVGNAFHGSGGRVAYTSTNGVSFDMVDLGSGGLNDVGYGGGTYLAVGPGGTAYTSADGLSWTQQVTGTTAPLNDIAYGNGSFVVLGGFGDTLIQSTNGVDWVVALQDNTFFPTALAFGSNMFIAATANRMYTSEDGVDWTEQLTPPTQFVQRMHYYEGRFIGVGYTIIQSSVDGTSWTMHESGTVHNLSDIVFDGSTFVVVGNDDLSGNPTIRQSVSGTTGGPLVFLNPRWVPENGFGFDIVAPVPSEIEIWKLDTQLLDWELHEAVPVDNSPATYVDSTALEENAGIYQGRLSP